MKIALTVAVIVLFACSSGNLSTTAVHGRDARLVSTNPEASVKTSTTVKPSLIIVADALITSTTILVSNTTLPALPELTETRFKPVVVSTLTEIEAALCAPIYDWNCSDAMHVSFCESSNRAGIISKPNSNGTRDFGLMQINDGAWSYYFGNKWADVLDLHQNIAMAHQIYSLYKWQPWTCAP